MKCARLLRAIGEVDPAFVDIGPIEKGVPKKRPLVWMRWASVAACFVLIAACGFGAYCIAGGKHKIVYPTENTPSISDQDSHVKPCSYFDLKEPYTYSTLAADSEIIVVADVIGVVEGTLFQNQVYVSVCEVLKGDVSPEDVLSVADPMSGFYSNAEGVLMMQWGNRVLLFLEKSGVTDITSQGEEMFVYRFVHVYPSIGKFFYDSDGKYHEAATYGHSFPTFLSDKLFTDYEPKTLEEIKELIGAE